MVSLAPLAFLAIFFFGVPFPVIVLTAGVIGYIGGRAGHAGFKARSGHGSAKSGGQVADSDTLLGESCRNMATPMSPRQSGYPSSASASGLMPVATLLLTLGPDHVFSRIATFFSTMAS